MIKIALVIAVGGAALLGGTAANADSSMTEDAGIDVIYKITDFGAQRRHHGYRHHGYRHHRSYGYPAPRRAYYPPQGYYAQPYYGGYGYGGPGISLGFGSGYFGGYGGHHGGYGGHHGGHH